MTDEPLPPTQRLPSAMEAPSRSPRPGRGLLIVIIVLLVLLLAAIGVVIALLVSGANQGNQPTAIESASPIASPRETSAVESPSPTPTPSRTVAGTTPAKAKPTARPRPAPKPTPTADGAPVFTSFSIPNATCDSDTGTSPVTIQYSSVGATEAYFGINVANAKEAPSEGPLPPNGPFTFDFQCSNSPQTWVITLVDGAGGTTNRSHVVFLHDPE